ncbi:hypothetical protein THAOC_22301 [Thalassiosira oceanica]|uniref:Uncharacterized protein n=1 Tax=Thalassiosira oceanica TaxID=159749 RepID=K0RYW6_THAOC|nr:hypothetical protein THAOC_22301 [Thalassiosira oceanica]|eukprot:EJK57634.1 hypothetical protein THAOC_22301 [Thalassiosira oceanica]
MKFLIASVAAASLLLSALPRGASAIRDHQFSEQVKAAMRSSLSFDCCQTAGDCPPKYKLFGKTGGGNTLCQVDKPVTDCSAMSTDDYPKCEAAPTPSSTPAAPSITPPAAPASSSSATCSNASDFVQGWGSVTIDSVNGRQSCVAAQAGSTSTSGGTATVNGKIFNAPFAPCPGASSMSSASEHGVGLAAVAAGIGMAAIF